MKQYVLIVIFACLCLPSKGQAFSLAIPNRNQKATAYSFASFQNSKPEKRICTTTKAGLITIGTGFVTCIIGFAFMFSNDDSGNTISNGGNVNRNQGELGTELLIGGLILTGIGGGLATGGGIYDATRHHKRKWSLAVPKMNEMGFAYNFK